MGRTQRKKEENTWNQNTSPPTKDQNSSPTREQSWMENDCDEMMELDFRSWIMRNFCELKEHVLNQCKETKNHEKRFEEMITRMDNLERNMNELRSWKTQHKNFVKQAQLSKPNWPSRRKNIWSRRPTQWNKTRNQDQRKKRKTEWTMSPRNVGLCEKT